VISRPTLAAAILVLLLGATSLLLMRRALRESPGDHALGSQPAASAREVDELSLDGWVRTPQGEGLPGVFVTARDQERRMATTVVSGSDGRFELPPLPPRVYSIGARASGRRTAALGSISPGDAPEALQLTLEPDPGGPGAVRSSDRLASLPDGETKRRFILDCTGCHQFGEAVTDVEGRPRTRAEWKAAVERMLSFAGARTSFPIISPERDPAATAEWLASSLEAGPDSLNALARVGTGSGGSGESPDAGRPVEVAGSIGSAEAPARAMPAAGDLGLLPRAIWTEYDLPQPDLPHDLAIDPEGRIVATGMFRNVMYYLDPGSGDLAQIPIPVPQANPRAVEIDRTGVWWVLLGAPKALARLDPMAGAWKTIDIGLYAHSIARDSSGSIWFNGHFSRNPIDLGSLDPATGEIRRYRLPPNGGVKGSPIPYELRVGPDGSIWGSELLGNRIFRFWPGTGASVAYELPTSHSGPRRLDVAPDGTLWIPAYAAGSLVRFDPQTQEFTEYSLPTRDALPYVARVDPRSGAVWVAEAGADAIARFDPASSRWVEFPLPTRSALIRHLVVDPRTGAVWGAYANAPPVEPKIVRLELRGP
jgi:virginiamycin B lyase